MPEDDGAAEQEKNQDCSHGVVRVKKYSKPLFSYFMKSCSFLPSPKKEPKKASPDFQRSAKMTEWTDLTKVVDSF